MRPPLLSVYLLCFNERPRLKAALSAQLPALDARCELIVVDDGSTDGGAGIAEEIAAAFPDIRIRIDRKAENRGINHRMNEALAATAAPYIAFTACDDRLSQGAMARLLDMMEAHPGAALASAPSLVLPDGNRADAWVSPHDLPCREPAFISAEACTRHFERAGHWIMSNTTIFRTAALREIGGFDGALGPFADGYATMRLACRHGVAFDTQPLGEWHRSSDTHSGRIRRDPERSLELLSSVEARMISDDAAFLTPGFRDRFARRWRFNLIHDLMSLPTPDSAGARRAAGPAAALAVRAALWLSARLGYSRIATALLYAGLRPFDVAPWLGRAITGGSVGWNALFRRRQSSGKQLTPIGIEDSPK